MDEAVALTGMEYGGITPIGLPGGLADPGRRGGRPAGDVVIGSGVRRSKLLLPASELLGLPRVRRVALAF